jgi:Resolvase, N terminal domain
MRPLQDRQGNAGGAGHSLGYARVSTAEQHLDLQVDALTAAGCYRVFTDTASGAAGALAARPELDRVLDQLRPGDTLVVWKLDRLGRSLRHLVDTVTALADRGVGFHSLQDRLPTGERERFRTSGLCRVNESARAHGASLDLPQHCQTPGEGRGVALVRDVSRGVVGPCC